jgi:hypothetical protein
LTVSQLDVQRTLALPLYVTLVSELRGRLIRFGEESAEHKRIAGDLLFGLENTYKVLWGRLSALDDPALMAQKRSEETDLKQKAKAVAAKLGPDFGDPWAQMDQSQAALQDLYVANFTIGRGPIGSTLFDYARRLVRGAWCAPPRSGPSLRPNACRAMPTASCPCCRSRSWTRRRSIGSWSN